MSEYQKIQTVYKRDMGTPGKPPIDGAWSLPEFGALADLPWEWTEKIDGTNIRVICKAGKVEFRGKTDNAQMPGPLDRALHSMFDDNQPLRDLGDDVLIYGEGFGAGIQRGGCYRPDPSFIVFDAVIGGYWLRRADVYDVARQLGVASVAVVGIGTLTDAIAVVRGGLQSAIARCPAEGLVMRPPVELWNRRGERIITKIKTRDFAP